MGLANIGRISWNKGKKYKIKIMHVQVFPPTDWLKVDQLQFDTSVSYFANYYHSFFDQYEEFAKNKNGYKILHMIEPDQYLFNYNRLEKCYTYFDKILTWDKNVLSQYNNAELFVFGTSWLNESDLSKINKQFSISMLVGHKTMMIGQILRHEIWNRQLEISIPRNFQISGQSPIDFRNRFNIDNNKTIGLDLNSKIDLFHDMFHVCVENVSTENWFTEKLIDCLYSKTIPIYYGCPNIDQYFDTTTILCFNTVDQLLKIVNSLTPDFYYKNIKSIEFNFEKSKQYLDLNQRLVQKITQLVK